LRACSMSEQHAGGALLHEHQVVKVGLRLG